LTAPGLDYLYSLTTSLTHGPHCSTVGRIDTSCLNASLSHCICSTHMHVTDSLSCSTICQPPVGVGIHSHLKSPHLHEQQSSSYLKLLVSGRILLAHKMKTIAAMSFYHARILAEKYSSLSISGESSPVLHEHEPPQSIATAAASQTIKTGKLDFSKALQSNSRQIFCQCRLPAAEDNTYGVSSVRCWHIWPPKCQR
jgi:hypothetical protein